METKDATQLDDAMKLHDMFTDQAKSEIRCANNILRDAFTPFMTMLTTRLIKHQHYLFAQIELKKLRRKWIVIIDLMWYPSDGYQVPDDLVLTPEEDAYVAQIMASYADYVNMKVEYGV